MSKHTTNATTYTTYKPLINMIWVFFCVFSIHVVSIDINVKIFFDKLNIMKNVFKFIICLLRMHELLALKNDFISRTR